MTCPRRPAIDRPQRDSPYLAAYRPTVVCPTNEQVATSVTSVQRSCPTGAKNQGDAACLRRLPDSSTYLEGIALCRCKRDSEHDNQHDCAWGATKSILQCLHRPTMSLEYHRAFMSHQPTRAAKGMQHAYPPSANYAVN